MSVVVTALVRRKRLPDRPGKGKRPRAGNPVVKAVLTTLANYADDDGRNAFPSVPTMAEETELERTSVIRALEWLDDKKLIAEQEPARQHRPRTWLLRLDEIAALKDAKTFRGGSEQPLSSSRGGSEQPLADSSSCSEQPLKDSRRGSEQPLKAPEVARSISRGGSEQPDPSVTLRSTAASERTKVEQEDAAAEVLRLYSAGFERKVGEAYSFSPKAAQQATELLKTASLDRIRRVIAFFFDVGADDWFRREGYPWPAFIKQYGKFAAKAAAAGDADDRDPRQAEWDRNARRLAEAKKLPTTAMPDSLKRMVRNIAARHETTR